MSGSLLTSIVASCIFSLDAACHAQTVAAVTDNKFLLVKILEFSKKYPEHYRQLLICVPEKYLSYNNIKANSLDKKISNSNMIMLPNYMAGFQLLNCLKYGSITPTDSSTAVGNPLVFDSIYYRLNKIPANSHFFKQNKNGLYYKFGFSYAIIELRKCPNMIPPTKDALVPVKLKIVRGSNTSQKENAFVIGLLK